jgi:hypothetical protein
MLRSKVRPQTPPEARSLAHRDDSHPEESLLTRGVRPPFDWKGWVILAWVLWSGLSYGKMVLAKRSEEISTLVARLVKSI